METTYRKLKPFKRSKDYYNCNSFFLIRVPSHLRQTSESEFHLGKRPDKSDSFLDWEGNEAVNRMQKKYCFIPDDNFEINTEDEKFNTNQESSVKNIVFNGNQKMNSNHLKFTNDWHLSNNWNNTSFHSLPNKNSGISSFNLKHNTSYNDIPSTSDECLSNKCKLSPSNISKHFIPNDYKFIEQQHSHVLNTVSSEVSNQAEFNNSKRLKSLLPTPDRSTLTSLVIEKDKVARRKPLFGVFSHITPAVFHNQRLFPTPNITVESMINKIKISHPEYVVFLDLDYFYKFLWNLKKSIPPNVQIIAFHGTANRLPPQPNESLLELYNSDSFHLHPLVGIKKKGTFSKCACHTLDVADNELQKDIPFLILSHSHETNQRLRVQLIHKGRSTHLLSNYQNLIVDFYSYINNRSLHI